MSHLISRVSKVLVLLVLVTALVRVGEAQGAESTCEDNDHEVLLEAINFALTGHDGITYTFSDRRECVVTDTHASTQQGVQAIETFYFNHIDASGIPPCRSVRSPATGARSMRQRHGRYAHARKGYPAQVRQRTSRLIY